jgi:hypothetical protein
LSEVSSRHALAIAIVFALATIPGFVHRGGRLLREDCRDPEALLRADPAAARDAPPAPDALGDAPRTRLSVRRFPLAGGVGTLDLYVVQASNPGVMYRPPDLQVIQGVAAARRTIEFVEHGGERLPIHRTHYDPYETRNVTLAGHLAVFDSRPVANPYLAELRAAPGQLLAGRKPVWVFFAHADAKRGAREVGERALREALASAWDEYRAACLP